MYEAIAKALKNIEMIAMNFAARKFEAQKQYFRGISAILSDFKVDFCSL